MKKEGKGKGEGEEGTPEDKSATSVALASCVALASYELNYGFQQSRDITPPFKKLALKRLKPLQKPYSLSLNPSSSYE